MADDKELPPFAQELTDLYSRETYKGDHIEFDEFDKITINGQEYAVGIYRSKDPKDTDFGHYKPHMRMHSITFLAPIKDGKLAGNSIRISARSSEATDYSSQYKADHYRAYSDGKYKDGVKPFTYIEIDINQPENLPRYTIRSDRSISGYISPDFSTSVDDFCNVCDRREILAALTSQKGKNKDIFENCSSLIVPTKQDESEKLTEEMRQQTIASEKHKAQEVQKIKALRKFIAQHPEEKGLFGKWRRKKAAKEFITTEQKQKAMNEEKFAVDMCALKDILGHRR